MRKSDASLNHTVTILSGPVGNQWHISTVRITDILRDGLVRCSLSIIHVARSRFWNITISSSRRLMATNSDPRNRIMMCNPHRGTPLPFIRCTPK